MLKKRKIYIFGKDWPTPDGTCIRDYIHIEDLAEGHIAALETLCFQQIGYLNVNLGTGRGTSILELINLFEKVNDVKIDYEFSKRRAGDCPILVADNTMATKKLKWNPSRDLESMCRWI